VCLALGEQALGVGAVDLEALGLAITRAGRALVPVDPEPGPGGEDGAGVLLGRALEVSVPDAHHEDAAPAASEGPVEQRGAGAAHVQMPGGTGRKADTNGLRHGSPLYPG